MLSGFRPGEAEAVVDAHLMGKPRGRRRNTVAAPTLRLTLLLLLRYRDHTISLVTLAALLGQSKHVAQRAVRDLVDLGLVRGEPGHRAGLGYRPGTKYTVFAHRLKKLAEQARAHKEIS